MLGKQYTPEELKKLQQRAAKAARKFQSAVAANQKQVRADDTRRKVIAGALALEHADKNPGSEFAHVLLRLDESSYAGGTMGADHPIAWTRELNGARVWYTAMGHTSCSFVDHDFLTHVRGGIIWAAHAESLSVRSF